nr:glycosyltransferase [Clostridia bacterium]
MSDNIKVSVVMPIYNAYSYLRPAIDCVIDQTLQDIELICVDDGSTDHSLDILKEYQQLDKRVRIITQSNAGPSIARNKGLMRARGDFVIFLDADDFVENTLLEKLYTLAVEDNLDIAVAKFDIYNDKKARFEPAIKCDHGEIFEENRVVSKSTYPDCILQSTTMYIWNKLFRRSFLKEKELSFDPELRVFEDAYFVVTSLSLASAVGKVHEVLVHHRVYADQAKKKLFKKYFRQVPEIYARIKDFLMHYGMYTPLSQSFLNLSASRFYKIYNLLWSDAKEEFFDMYHFDYAERLGWTKAHPEEFEAEEVRDFVASVLMYTHKQYARRDGKGKRVKIDRVGPYLRFKARLEKFKGYFRKNKEKEL